ncbi:MAG: hypothetical protein HYZ71_10570 [Deltaproteobacteria bacterium]|nr:hypothetical protein [Deltaproteobacteria bacterium]
MKPALLMACLKASLALAAPTLHDRVRQVALAVPNTIEAPSRDPNELYEQVFEAMLTGLTYRQARELKKVEGNTNVNSQRGGVPIPYFDAGIHYPTGQLSMQVPKEFIGTPGQAWMKLHELAHYRLALLIGLKDFVIDANQLDNLALVRYFMDSEDHSYRWEWLYLHNLSRPVQELLLSQLHQHVRNTGDITSLLMENVIRASRLPRSQYLAKQRASDREGSRHGYTLGLTERAIEQWFRRRAQDCGKLLSGLRSIFWGNTRDDSK